jgi:hypothetical protein
LCLHGAGREPHAFQFVFVLGLRLADPFLLLCLEEGDLPLLGLNEPIQLGNVTAELNYGSLGRGRVGLDLPFRQTADFLFQDGGNVGRGSRLLGDKW